jgi:Ca2+-binding EF-hand superfamily protein
MYLKHFMQSIGLIGYEYAPHLASRIFKVVSAGKTVVRLKDYIMYLDVLLNGTLEERARLSFDILDEDNSGELSLDNIENMIVGVSELWFYLTGSHADPIENNKNYIKRVFNEMDYNNDGKITFRDDWIPLNQNHIGIIGWFEYLNMHEPSLKGLLDDP